MSKDFQGARVNSEIALILIKHMNDLARFLSDYKTINLHTIDHSIAKIKTGKKFLIDTKAESFYKNNKKMVDDILPVTSIFGFYHTLLNVDTNELSKDYGEFINYVCVHKEATEKIYNLVKAIKDLHIAAIVLDEGNKFEYTITVNYGKYAFGDFAYGENIRVIPTYEQNEVKYYFDGTNYIIPLKNDFGKVHLSSRFSDEIVVNNLLFSPDVLPKSKSKEDTLDKIVQARNMRIHEINTLRDDIDLSFIITDLSEQIESSLNNISRISTIKDKEAVIDYLYSMKHTVSRIAEINRNNEEEIVNDTENGISSELLLTEKSKYLKKRLDARYDID